MFIEDYRKQCLELADWATPGKAGAARRSFIQSLFGAGDAYPVFTLNFGRARFTIDSQGNEFAHAVDAGTEPDPGDIATLNSRDKEKLRSAKFPIGVHTHTGIPAGAAPTNKMIGSLRVPSGVVLVVGGASSGKTPLVHALAGATGSDYDVVRYGEPLAGYICDESLAARFLCESVLRTPDVVVDSVKDILAEATGGSMKSGISRGALPILSRWGSIAASVGATLYIPVNPSSKDSEVIDLLVEASESNATSVFYYVDSGVWNYTSRRGEGLRREEGSFHTKYTGDGLVEVQRVTRNAISPETNDPGVEALGRPVVVSDEQMAAAIRRASSSI